MYCLHSANLYERTIKAYLVKLTPKNYGNFIAAIHINKQITTLELKYNKMD